jgi:hypothetical protein
VPPSPPPPEFGPRCAQALASRAAGTDEGRHSESCRRLTCLVLFGPHGRPGTWLVVLALAWALVAGVTLGTPDERPVGLQAATVSEGR